jgi:chorismate mutase / prephenate dehydratase
LGWSQTGEIMQGSDSGRQELAQLRRRIDAIDDRLHDLLMQRTELAVAVGALKAANTPLSGTSPAEGAKFIRPAREAAIIRRLVERHRGPLPKAVLVRMWREMISALLQVEGPFAVAVHVPANKPGYWDMARDHYGGLVRMTSCATAKTALDAVVKGKATVAVLPYPSKAERNPWWFGLIPPQIARSNAKARNLPHVIACLPFGNGGNQRDPKARALVVGNCEAEATERDRSLLVLQTSALLSGTALRAALTELGSGAALLGRRKGNGRQPSLALIEAEGCYAALDPRLERLATRLGKNARLISIGTFAAPLSQAERKDAKAPRHHGVVARGASCA